MTLGLTGLIISIGGTKKAMDDPLYDDLEEVVVESSWGLPAMFTLLLRDKPDNQEKFTYIDGTTFKLGAEIKVEITTEYIPDEGKVTAPLIIGEITALEPIFTPGHVVFLRVRGYDRSHHLARGKKTRVYGDGNPKGSGIDDAQIISTILQETGALTGKSVDTMGFSGVKLPYVMQYNQTDLEFLWERARIWGYQVYVQDKTLYFQKADKVRNTKAPATLIWGNNLESFEPRLTLAGQVDQAVVKGWNADKKQVVEGVGKNDSSKTVPDIPVVGSGGPSLAKSAFKGASATTVVDQPLSNDKQATAMANAIFAEMGSQVIQAEGSCRIGDPRLLAGQMVKIEGVGQKFEGSYYVTEARHMWSQGKYHVTFSISGRSPNTISHLLSEPLNGHHPHLIQGVAPALVIDIQDPEDLGRVKLKYPWLPEYKGAELASSWARIAAPMAGKERGFFYLPAVGDEVLVAFEHGNLDYPYIVGMLWNNVDKPPETNKNVAAKDKKNIDQLILRSRSGHLVILDDTEGKEQIIVQDKTEKNSIVIDSSKNTLTITSDQDLVITAKGNITLTSETGDVTIEGQKGKVNITAKLDSTIQASAMTLKANGKLDVQGSVLNLTANAALIASGKPIKLN
jgi:uncharacterized protein involved in type VI secretion and phage assembly